MSTSPVASEVNNPPVVKQEDPCNKRIKMGLEISDAIIGVALIVFGALWVSGVIIAKPGSLADLYYNPVAYGTFIIVTGSLVLSFLAARRISPTFRTYTDKICCPGD